MSTTKPERHVMGELDHVNAQYSDEIIRLLRNSIYLHLRTMRSFYRHRLSIAKTVRKRPRGPTRQLRNHPHSLPRDAGRP
jgi:hypothetical protein